MLDATNSRAQTRPTPDKKDKPENRPETPKPEHAVPRHKILNSKSKTHETLAPHTKDANLGIVRAAVSKSFTVDAVPGIDV